VRFDPDAVSDAVREFRTVAEGGEVVAGREVGERGRGGGVQV
jgi:hypothetical protein